MHNESIVNGDHLKFCFVKGVCSLLSHVLTQPDSKCLAAA